MKHEKSGQGSRIAPGLPQCIDRCDLGKMREYPAILKDDMAVNPPCG
jgi:hypothetical protein